MQKKIDKSLWKCPRCLGHKNARYSEGSSSRLYILPCAMCSPSKRIDDKLFYSYRDEVCSGFKHEKVITEEKRRKDCKDKKGV